MKEEMMVFGTLLLSVFLVVGGFQPHLQARWDRVVERVAERMGYSYGYPKN